MPREGARGGGGEIVRSVGRSDGGRAEGVIFVIGLARVEVRGPGGGGGVDEGDDALVCRRF